VIETVEGVKEAEIESIVTGITGRGRDHGIVNADIVTRAIDHVRGLVRVRQTVSKSTYTESLAIEAEALQERRQEESRQPLGLRQTQVLQLISLTVRVIRKMLFTEDFTSTTYPNFGGWATEV
jgi:hypothetical protein